MHKQRIAVVVLSAVSLGLLFMPLAAVECVGDWCGFLGNSQRGLPMVGFGGLFAILVGALLASVVGTRNQAFPTWVVGALAVPALYVSGSLIAEQGTVGDETRITVSLNALGYLEILILLAVPILAFVLRHLPARVVTAPVDVSGLTDASTAGGGAVSTAPVSGRVPLFPGFVELGFLAMFGIPALLSSEAKPRNQEDAANAAAFVVAVLSLALAKSVRMRRDTRMKSAAAPHDLHAFRDVSVGLMIMFLGPFLGTTFHVAAEGGPLANSMLQMCMFAVMMFFAGALVLGLSLRAEHSVGWGIVLGAGVLVGGWLAWSSIGGSDESSEFATRIAERMGAEPMLPALAEYSGWALAAVHVLNCVGLFCLAMSLLLPDSGERQGWRKRVVLSSIVSLGGLAVWMIVSALGSIQKFQGATQMPDFVGAASVWRVFFVLESLGVLKNEYNWLSTRPSATEPMIDSPQLPSA